MGEKSAVVSLLWLHEGPAAGSALKELIFTWCSFWRWELWEFTCKYSYTAVIITEQQSTKQCKRFPQRLQRGNQSITSRCFWTGRVLSEAHQRKISGSLSSFMCLESPPPLFCLVGGHILSVKLWWCNRLNLLIAAYVMFVFICIFLNSLSHKAVLNCRLPWNVRIKYENLSNISRRWSLGSWDLFHAFHQIPLEPGGAGGGGWSLLFRSQA